MLLVTLAFASGLRVPEIVQYLPFAASLLLFGLPHGAIDHLVPDRLAGRPVSLRGMLGVGLLYLVLSGLCLAAWFTVPVAAFALFVAVTVFHWGAGDLHALLFFGPGEFLRTTRLTRISLLLARGGIPMLVPLLAFPDAYRAVAVATAGLFDGDQGPVAAFSPTFRLVVGLALAGIVLVSLLSAARDLSGSRGAVFPLAAETLLLTLFFAVVPPVFAVGLYFALWHAPRHIARLTLLDKASPPGARRSALARFARDAVPMTAIALALLAGLYFAVPASAANPASLLALYLVLVSALTVPHAALVAFMDRRQGLWKSPRPAA